MAPDDMLAGKRPRLDDLNPASLHTAASVTQNWSLLPAPESHLPVELITAILKLRFPNYCRSTQEMAELYGIKLVSKAWKEYFD
ncbi:hypothetical protein M407DRAFT_181340 [Tulasnella calospora MUT 4182]|uniref:Uncharacterized protein n=1 Tax=Tulasnella calospora MUT 4182 TaxID=1051891 RepID=A0A0C3QLK9_9AGAM|nr:hypothetical protein M407DRAFT_181340 [Tulasnella calospora MUT 4182]